MSLYDRVAARRGGARALACARLKREVLGRLHQAFAGSGLQSQSDLARRLGVRRSAVNQVFNGDGNLRTTTVAEYLYEMGYELDVTLVRAGEPRAAATEGRKAQSAVPSTASITTSSALSPGDPLRMWEQSASPRVIVRVSAGSEFPGCVVVRSWPSESDDEPISRGLAIPVRVGSPEGNA